MTQLTGAAAVVFNEYKDEGGTKIEVALETTLDGSEEDMSAAFQLALALYLGVQEVIDEYNGKADAKEADDVQ